MSTTRVFVIVDKMDKDMFIIQDRQTGCACLCNKQTAIDLVSKGNCVYGVEFDRDATGKVTKAHIVPCKSVKLQKDFKCFVVYRLRTAEDMQYGIKTDRLSRYSDNKILNCLVNFLYNKTGLLFTLNSGKATDITDSECRVNIKLENNGETFILDYLYIPKQYRGKTLSSRVMDTLIEFAKMLGCVEFVLYPFPSDLYQEKKQGVANINKLIRFYKKFGFELSNEADFKGFFSYGSGRTDYSHRCYFDDLCGCNEMILELR